MNYTLFKHLQSNFTIVLNLNKNLVKYNQQNPNKQIPFSVFYLINEQYFHFLLSFYYLLLHLQALNSYLLLACCLYTLSHLILLMLLHLLPSQQINLLQQSLAYHLQLSTQLMLFSLSLHSLHYLLYQYYLRLLELTSLQLY